MNYDFCVTTTARMSWQNVRVIIIIIIIKTSSTGQGGKTKLLYKLLSQPHKHLRHEKQKKTQLRETTYAWLRPWTHPAFQYQIQCNEGHSTFEPGQAENTLQIGRSTPDTSNSNVWATAAARDVEL